jgi:hypothetical protein
MASGQDYKRVNILITESQYQELSERELNFSGLIRDLLGDYLSHHSITLQVSDETRRIYDTVISNTGSTDQEIEIHLRAALAEVLEKQIESMQNLRKLLKQK